MLEGILQTTLQVLLASWWVIIPVGLFFVWKDFWVWGLNYLWKSEIQWTLLEIRIPKNILKTPKAMENAFAALHGIYLKSIRFEDRYFKGDDLFWFSCELVGYAGGVTFYIRCPFISRNLVESAIYSEYPDAEILEAEDYTELMPEILPNDTYDIWGQDFVLAKPNPYPIKTYEFFEANVEEQRLDPIAAITEVMSRLKEGEAIWLQYLIRPVTDIWKKEGEDIRDKFMQRKKSKELSYIEGLVDFLKKLVDAPFEHPIWGEAEKDKEKFIFLSPGESVILKAVENKISKLGFETAIRFIYIDRRDSFTWANIAAVNGVIKQFNTQDMNSFRPISDTVTFITSRKLTFESWFRKRRVFYRKRMIFNMYKARWFPGQNSILNTEELATIFHFPLITVGAPLLRRVETRKGEPPPGLPME